MPSSKLSEDRILIKVVPSLRPEFDVCYVIRSHIMLGRQHILIYIHIYLVYDIIIIEQLIQFYKDHLLRY